MIALLIASFNFESHDRPLVTLDQVEGSEDPAIVILDKLPFTEETAANIVSNNTRHKHSFLILPVA